MLRPIERIYAPLAAHLAGRGAARERRVTLPLAAIEALLGRPLPATARRPRGHRPWWLDGAHRPHAWYGWLRVGWQVAAVDLAAETVTFARAAGTGCCPRMDLARVRNVALNPWGAMLRSTCEQGGSFACLPTSIGVGVDLVAAGWGGGPGRERAQREAAGNATVTRS